MAVPPVNRRFGASLLYPFDVPLEMRIATRQVDQYPVEPISPLQLHQRIGKSVRATPDVDG
jgi:hypothetical protein